MRGIWNIVFGLIFVVGGLSGQLALIGTNSGGALALLGLVLLVVGGYQAMRSRAGGDAPSE